MPENRGYPSGIYGPGNGPPDDLAAMDRDAAAGNDPSLVEWPISGDVRTLAADAGVYGRHANVP